MLLLLCQRVVIRAVSGTTRWGGDNTVATLFHVLLTDVTLDAEAILANTHHPAEPAQLLCECLQGLVLEANYQRMRGCSKTSARLSSSVLIAPHSRDTRWFRRWRLRVLLTSLPALMAAPMLPRVRP
jgi:hypothetical protein